MPTNSQQAIARGIKIASTIKDMGESSLRELEGWALLTLGIQNKTLGAYLNALESQGFIKLDLEKRMVYWDEKPIQEAK